MDAPPPSGITRRSAIASFGGIAGLTALSGCVDEKKSPRVDPLSRKLSRVREEFERLLPLWQEERNQYTVSSNTYDYWQGPHGKAIIALGPAILPYLIQQVKAGDFWFNVPLALITHLDIANGKYDSE